MEKAQVVAVENLLQRRRFDEITPTQWGDIFLSLFSAEETETAAFQRRPPAVGVAFEGHIDVVGALRLYSRGEGSYVPAIMFLNELSLIARSKLRQGLTNLAKQFHRTAKKDPIAARLLSAVLGASESMTGAISSEMLACLAEDRKLEGHLRSMAACQLADKRPIEAPPVKFWDKLEKQLPQCPDLLVPCLLYEVKKNGRPIEFVLELMAQAHPTEKRQVVALPSILGESLDEIGNLSAWSKELKEILGRLPTWAIDLLKQEVVPFVRHHKQLSKLMPK